MKKNYSQSFDIPTLLRLGDLDVRGIAAGNSSLLSEEYFYSLSQLVIQAPKVEEALKKIADHNGDRETFQCLTDTKVLLIKLGCNARFMSDIDVILDADIRGNKKFAATSAEKFSHDFDETFKRIMMAKTDKLPSLTDPHDSDEQIDEVYEAPEDSNETLYLRDVLKRIDYEELNRKLCILAIDDSRTILNVITSILGNDYDILALAKPTMLEKVLARFIPELFLLDYQMPERSGFDLVHIIRAYEEHRSTPIIFVTSLGTIDNLITAVSLGASDFVVKPIQPDILCQKVAKHIVRKKRFYIP